MNSNLIWLTEDDPPERFPPVEAALTEPDGLLAAGGDLRVERLLHAYRNGIFPWYEEGQPLLWWSPNPRCVFLPGDFRVARRLRQEARNTDLEIRVNTSFSTLIRACAGRRKSQQGTWITMAIIEAFEELHAMRWAHSVEVWRADELVGGLYGLCIGKAFFGESMFSARSNASKFALLYLANQLASGELAIVDCQVVSGHLLSLGARTLPRDDFVRGLRTQCDTASPRETWPGTPLPVRDLCFE